MPMPLPTDDSPRPVWWRNRRRWFYAAVAAATLGVLGGAWWWWYEADFPLPEKMERVGYGAGSIPDWVLRQRANLWEWKGRRLAADLRLVGSVWEDEETGGILEFGADGRMRWRRFPKVGRREWESVEAVLKRFDATNQLGVDGLPDKGLVEEELQRLEGIRYRVGKFRVTVSGMSSNFEPVGKVRLGVEGSLGFPDQEGYFAQVGYYREDLYFLFMREESDVLDHRTLIFTRRIEP